MVKLKKQLTAREIRKRQYARSHQLRALTDHCVICFADEPLVVHHLKYRPGGRGSPLEQPEDLVVLCPQCHDALHRAKMEATAKFKEFRDQRRLYLFDQKTVPDWIRL